MHFVALCAVLALSGLHTTSHQTKTWSRVKAQERARLMSVGPAGSVPAGFPNRLGVGLFEDTGRTWMKQTQLPWQVRYRYLTYKWSSNWGFGPRDGAFAGEFFAETGAQGFMPAISYYEMYDLPPSNTGFGAKTQNQGAMLEYFQDFKLLMQQARAFGKPVLVLLEPDGFAYLQGDSGNNPNAVAAIASTGMPELQGLPNTAAGWGLAFLQIRKAVGATNVILGIHISGWATGHDLFHFSVTDPLPAAVDTVYNFLAPLGLAPNQTGSTYDVLVGDPLDRDADFYRLTRAEDRWWDPSDTVGVNTKSFNRYAEWLRLWNLKSSLRWVLWQIPIGNSLSPNTCSRGYKDNRTEYFFGGAGAGHRQKFVDVGVVSLLFGAGADCQATQETDGDYLKIQATPYLTGPGIPLGAGTVPDAGTPPVVDAGTPPVPDAGTPVASIQYDFETGVQGWTTSGRVLSGISSSTGLAATGTHALALKIAGTVTGTQQVQISNPGVPAGKTINFQVFFAAGTPISSIQVYAQESQSTAWRWNGNWKNVSSLKAGAWNLLTVTLPPDASTVQSLGIEVTVNKRAAGTVYLDSVSWGGAQTVPDAGTPPVVDAGTPPVVDAGTPPAVDAGTLPVPDAGSPPPGFDAGTISGTIHVMPLGDSITAEEWSWRCALLGKLTGSGRNAVMVGSVHNGYDPCAPDHEGNSGWNIDNLTAQLQNWLLVYRPDVITVLYGTNDVAWWTTETGTQIADRANAGLTQMQKLLPGVRIVVMTLPPESSSIIAPNNVNRQVLVQQYNDRLRFLVAARVAAGERIRLADINTVLTLSDLRDGIHPTPEAGINKMTPVIWNAMQQLLP